jgi:hypothetical protein
MVNNKRGGDAPSLSFSPPFFYYKDLYANSVTTFIRIDRDRRQSRVFLYPV